MKSLVTLLDRLVEGLACIVLVALLGCVTLGVVSRELSDPVIWTDEFARFLMIWLAVLGWILACRRRSHVRIRFFQDLLPRRAWRLAEGVIQLGMLLFGLLVAGYGLGLTWRNRELEAMTIEISFAWMYAPMVLAGVFTAGQALAELLDLGRRPHAASPVNESVVE